MQKNILVAVIGWVVITSCTNLSNTPAAPAPTQNTVGATIKPSAPVDVKTDDALNYSVKSVMQNYPGTHAEIDKGEITLQGEIKRADLPKLMMSLNTLHPKNIVNNLKIK